MLSRLLLALILSMVFPTSAFAYSYGDPNKEDIAETYKEIAAKLEQKPEDWNGAHQAFLSRKNEIALEFGDKTAQILEENLKQKQKDLVLHNYRAVLVKNIDRRLDNAEKQFADYAKAKLLLAKGRGTLSVLAPNVSDSASKTAFAAFDKALAALGNPGLFGVGTVPADKKEFLAQTTLIRSTLNPLYQLKGSAPTPAAQKPAATGNQTPKPAASPAGQVTPAASANKATKQPANGQAAGIATEQSKNTTAQAATGQQPTTSQPVTTAGQQTAAPAAVSPATQPATLAVSQQTQSTAATDSKQPGSTTQETTAAPSVVTAQPTANPGAPSKVNPLVTVSVIGGLALVAGISFWFAKRKKMI